MDDSRVQRNLQWHPLPPATATTYECNPPRQDQGNPTASADDGGGGGRAEDSSGAKVGASRATMEISLNEGDELSLQAQVEWGTLVCGEVEEFTELFRKLVHSDKFKLEEGLISNQTTDSVLWKADPFQVMVPGISIM